MFGIKKKKKRTGGGKTRSPQRSRKFPRPSPALVKTALVALATLVAGSAAFAGVWALEAHVRAQPKYQAKPRIIMADAPAGLADRIQQLLAPVADGPWIDDTLCERIAKALDDSAWVERVNSVRRHADGTVVVSCEYRDAAVLIQTGNGFYLADNRGIRLPGRYSFHPSFVLVQGVGAPVPSPGELWHGADLAAALAIVERLRHEQLNEQVAAILVGNYAGRQNNRKAHIELVSTPPPPGRIIWGSAPGEEIEENSVEQKIGLLREIYDRWGRIDGGHAIIDISTFPDRFTIRAPNDLDGARTG